MTQSTHFSRLHHPDGTTSLVGVSAGPLPNVASSVRPVTDDGLKYDEDGELQPFRRCPVRRRFPIK